MARLLGGWENMQGVTGRVSVRILRAQRLLRARLESESRTESQPDPYLPGLQRPTFFESGGKQVPGVAHGRPVPNVPAEIDKLYDEARKSTAAGAHTAAVLACRKILMHIAVDHGARPGLSFIEYVEYLANNGFVPPKGKGWVDHIRKKGNEANHEIVVMGPDASKDLLTFIEMLLTFLYDFPARIQTP